MFIMEMTFGGVIKMLTLRKTVGKALNNDYASNFFL